MYNIMTQDSFIKSIALPIFVNHKEIVNKDLNTKSDKNLEEDVKIEEKYLDYLFHYAKNAV